MAADTHDVEITSGERYVVEVEGEIREAFVAKTYATLQIEPIGMGSVFIFADAVTEVARPERVRLESVLAKAVGWGNGILLPSGEYRFAYDDVSGRVQVTRHD